MLWAFLVIAIATGDQVEQAWWWGPFDSVKACQQRRTMIVAEVIDKQYNVVMSGCVPMLPASPERRS